MAIAPRLPIHGDYVVCGKCKIPRIFPGEFEKDAIAKCGRNLSRCVECSRARSREYARRPKSRARQKVRDAERRKDPAIRARLDASVRAFLKRKGPGYRLFNCAKDRARRLGLPFALRPADVVVPERCPLLDIPLIQGVGKLHAASPSLDQIIPGDGYVPGNVWVISYRANAIKQNASPDELEQIATRLRARILRRPE